VTGPPPPQEDPAATTGARYQLTLYVSGATELSAQAVADTRRLCDAHLGRACDLTVFDINEDPDALARSGIVAVPALVKTRPAPVKRVVGDLSEADRVLRVLELPRFAGRAAGAG